jgi:hypothetical protein
MAGPGPAVRVVVDNTKKNARYVRDLGGRFAEYRPILKTQGPVRDLIERAVIENFDTQGRYAGKPWPELAESTLKGRAGKGPILFEYGNLWEFIEARFDVKKRVDFDKRTFKITWDYPIAGYHQRGHEVGDFRARTRLPRREIVPNPFPESFVEKLRKIITGYLLTVVVK